MVNFVFGDFIANLNNAKRQHLISINVRNTKLVKNMIIFMYKLGLFRDITIVDSTCIEVFLKYIKRECAFKHIKLISVPGRRVYISLVKLVKLKEKSNASIYIISTSEGLKTDQECILSKLTGELLLKIEF